MTRAEDVLPPGYRPAPAWCAAALAHDPDDAQPTCPPIRGAHFDHAALVTGDHAPAITAELDRTCTGCLPRAATHGLVCQRCDERTRASLRELPDLHAELLEATGRGPGTGGSGGGAAPLPVDPDAVEARARIVEVLREWTLTLAAQRRITAPEATAPVERLAHLVAVHTGWLLERPAHADQLVHDIAALDRHVRPLARRGGSGAGPRALCTCGQGRLALDRPDDDGRVRCPACGRTDTIDGWRTALEPEAGRLLKLHEIRDWLHAHRGLDIPIATLRRRLERDQLPVLEVEVNGTMQRRYDPVSVAAAILAAPPRRRRTA